ncbi:YrdB family protein [Nocardiopsis sp. N85]|uniref:YrdB family protein n=1 Tax=Nocardiopsis sp. N85 TaxID=3029400 RepID=UPI00237F4E0D|nr:YrdB family protein [Nocardiopsis sp. N85]MDE3720863.1 YrdB family protein [Nocardiopsis sp. N85]
MSLRPWMLVVRLLLELAALVGFGSAAWHLLPDLRWSATFAVPLLVAAVWGTFAVPGDPSRSGRAPVPVPGPVRLLVEWAVLFGSSAALAWAGATGAALAFAGVLVVYQACAYDRVLWLLGRGEGSGREISSG